MYLKSIVILSAAKDLLSPATPQASRPLPYRSLAKSCIGQLLANSYPSSMIDDQTRKYLNELARKTADSWFVYRLMGFNLRNEDGTPRQRYIRRCKPLDRLQLISAPTRSDPKAIGVADAKGRQLGHLDRRCASQIRAAIENGTQFEVLVAAQWRDPQGECCLVAAILQLKPGLQASIKRTTPRPSAAPDDASLSPATTPRKVGRMAGLAMSLIGYRTENPATSVLAIR